MKRIIDLTHPVHEGMLTTPAPWHPVVEVTQLGRHHMEGRATSKVLLGSHTGTHIDAPYHFLEDGETIDEIPLDLLVGEAKMVDLSYKKPLEAITPKDFSSVRIEKNDRLIINTNWYKRWNTKIFYQEWPYLTEETGEFLINKGIILLGLDTPSPDDPKGGIKIDVDSPLHAMFLKKGIILVEFLTNLDEVKGTKFFFAALPLKVKGVDGFPGRVIAIEEGEG